MLEDECGTLGRASGEGSTRRRSLLTLGAAMLATVMASPRPVHAGKTSRKAKKRASKTCKRQIGACRTFFVATCASDPDCNEDEIDGVFPCCDLLDGCQAGASVECFFSLLT